MKHDITEFQILTPGELKHIKGKEYMCYCTRPLSQPFIIDTDDKGTAEYVASTVCKGYYDCY